jgi:hypothetical protein
MGRWQAVLGVGFAVVAIGMGWAEAAGAAEADPPKLQYGFQNGRQYVYDVKIVADLPNQEVTHTGSLTYSVVSTEGDQFALQCRGSLGQGIKAKGGRHSRFGRPGFGPPMMGPPHIPGPPGFGPFSEPRRAEHTTFNRQGEVIVAGQLHDLPFLLGKQEFLILEPLPKDPKAAWNTDVDLGVVEREESRHRFGPFQDTETSRGAKERIDFTVTASQADTVAINKKYSLKTKAEADGLTHIEMSGSGDLVFDRKEGVFQSQSMKYDIRVNEQGVSLTIPLTVSYRLLSQSEVEERAKQAAAAAAAAEEAARPKSLKPGEWEPLSKQLLSRDSGQIVAASKRLAKGIVDERQAEVSRTLATALDQVDDWNKGEVLAALRVWVTPEAEPAVIRATKSQTFFVRDAAIQLLGSFKTATAVEAAVEAISINRGLAAAALKAIGPKAEKAAIALLDDRNLDIRDSACDILTTVGSKRCLPLLKEQAEKAVFPHRRYYDQAIAAVEKRIAEGGGQPEEFEEPAAPEVRTWHDVSGTFAVQATFVSFKDGQVTLKRQSGGRTITLPLEKLSTEDQDYVKKQPVRTLVNPFE